METAMLNRWDRTLRPGGGGNGRPDRPEGLVKGGHRGRDVVALISLLLALAALWTAVYSVNVRSWGEYRPPAAELQDPPPAPTILLPALTLDDAQEILARVAREGEDSHGER